MNFNNFKAKREDGLHRINEAGNANRRLRGTAMVGGVYHADESVVHLHFGLSRQQVSKIVRRYDYTDVLENPSGLVITYHNDEDVSMYETGCRDVNELKRSLWNDFLAQRTPGEKFMEEFESEALAFTFSLDNADKIRNAEDLWEKISDIIDDSEPDGDSTYGINLIDAETCTCILGHSAE